MKWMWRLLKLSITAIVISLLTVMTTGYVVNSYVQSLLSSYNIPMANEAPTLGGMVKGMLGFGSKGDSKGGSKMSNKKEVAQDPLADPHRGTVEGDSDPNKSSGTSNGGEAVGGLETGSGSSSDLGASEGEATGGDQAGADKPAAGADQDQDRTGQPPEDSVAAMGGISSQAEQNAAGQQGNVLVTPEDLIAKKDEIPDQEKEEVFKILMTRLPQEEMQKLTESMEDGLTEKELIEIEQILSKYLDKTEYTKMMNILKK